MIAVSRSRTAFWAGVCTRSSTDARLSGTTEPVIAPGYPEEESFAVRRCLQTVLSEEWEHRLYAERDLAVLEARGS